MNIDPVQLRLTAWLGGVKCMGQFSTIEREMDDGEMTATVTMVMVTVVMVMVTVVMMMVMVMVMVTMS